VQDDVALLAAQTGLRNVLLTPEFQNALNTAVQATFGPIFTPDLVEQVRRFTAKGRRNDSRSYAVGPEPAAAGVAGRVRILERDEGRVEAIIYNFGTVAIFIGGRQVTVGGPNDASGGVPILPNTGLVLDTTIGELWAVSTVAGQDVRVLDIIGEVY
jgi:hypothetical protein